MDLHNFLSIVTLTSVCLFFFCISLNPCSAKHLKKLISSFTAFVSLLPSAYPVSARFSMPSFLFVWPRNFSLILVLCISVYGIMPTVFSLFLGRTIFLLPKISSSSIKRLWEIDVY